MVSKTADPAREDNEVRVADETTPLLNAAEPPAVPSSQEDNPPSYQGNGHPVSKASLPDQNNVSCPESTAEDEDKPMPYLQIILLCYASLAEPVAYFAIFPFINEMIHLKGHVAEKNVGFWSGMIESLFSLVQMVLMIFYGRAADRLGRKPVLVFSLTGVSIATAFFGMGQNLPQMVLLRCLAGCFAGSVVTIRTMISENCTKSTQARAFSWYMFVRNVGILIGPLIGGSFANPVEQFPRVFKGVPFWEKYPYALPGYIAGAVVFSSAITTLFFVNETLKRKIDGTSKPEATMSTLEVLKSPGVPMVLYILGHTMTLALMYTAVVPVFMFTSVKNGGLGFSDQWIAIFLAISGGSQALWMLLAFPYLQKRLGTGRLMRICACGWPIFLFSYPMFNEFLRNGWTLAFWILSPISLVMGSGGAMGFTCVQLCINDVSPSSTGFATLNALALSVTSGVRAVGPAVGTALYATGVRSGWAHGHLVFFVLFPIGCGLIVACNFLPENAEGRPKKAVVEEQPTSEE